MENYGEYYGYALIFRDGELSEDDIVTGPIPGEGICDKSKVYVKCGKCGQWMKYSRRRWICPVCGCKITHTPVYDYIQRLNQEFYDKFENDYDDIY